MPDFTINIRLSGQIALIINGSATNENGRETMKDIYIHVGTHKTGSTTIQHALRATSSAKAEEGWIYSGTSATMKEIMRANQYDKKLVQRFNMEVESMMQRAKSSNRVILSSEALCGSPDDGYSNSNPVFSMLRDATNQFNVKIVIFLRRQDSFVESMYTQKIHQGEALEFESFVERYNSPDALDYRRMLDDLRACFGDQNLIVRSYHESSKIGLLVDFGEIIGSKTLRYLEQGDKNPSYSRHALEIAKICNRSLDQSRKGQLRWALQATMAKDRFEPFSYFTDDERSKFLNRYQVSNRDVANRYFGGDLERLFPTPKVSKPISHNESLTYDDVAGLIVQILNGNSSNNGSGIIAGIRVALSGYPRLRRLIQKVRRRV